MKEKGRKTPMNVDGVKITPRNEQTSRGTLPYFGMQQVLLKNDPPLDCIARNYIHNSMQLSPSPTCKSDHLGTQPILILTFMILNNRSMVMVMINVKRVVIEQRLTPKVHGYFKSNIPTQIYTYGNGYYRTWRQDTETFYY